MYGLALGRAGAEQPNSIQNAALGILRKFGTNAHVYLPGSTVTTYGPELVTNGAFDNGTANWTPIGTASLSVSGGALLLTAAAGYDQTRQAITGLTIGKSYLITGSIGASVDNSYVEISGGSGSGLGASARSFSFTQVATATSHTLCLILTVAGTVTFDNISVREVITTSTPISGLLSNNYTLSDGSTGYSAVDGTAGLVLDGAGSVGADLTSGESWSISSGASESGGVVTFTAPAAYSGHYKVFSAAVAKTYLVTCTISGYVSGSIKMLCGDVGGPALSANGTYSVLLKAVSTASIAYIQVQASFVGVVSGVTSQEVTGIHATQSTTANKPALRRGLYNLAYPSDPSHVDWAKVGATPVTGGIQEDTSGGTHRTQRNITIPSGSPVTARVKLLSTTRNAQLELGGGTGGASVTFGLSGAGSVLVAAATYGTGWTVQAATIRLDSVDGYYECVLSATPNSGVTSVVSYLYMTSGSSAAYTGNGTSTLLTKEFGLFAGTLTASQILAEGGIIPLTTSTAASNSGAGRYSWQFDGVNDSLALGSVPFQMSDDHCVIAGFAPNAGNVYVVGITNAGGTTMCGNLRLASNGTLSAWWKDDVAAQSLIYGSGSVIGTTLVASSRKVGNVKSLRSNGTQVATDSTVLGTTTLTNANIGSLASAGFMNGSIGPVILIKGTVSDADLLTLERWVASLTPGFSGAF